MSEDVTNVIGLYTFECAHNKDPILSLTKKNNNNNGPEAPRDRSLKGL